jgi:DNA-binding response OmpR family regulator
MIAETVRDFENGFCPRCGGALARQPRLLSHPCFDDATRSIRPADGPARHLTPGQWAMLGAFRAAFDRIVSLDYLASHRGEITRCDDPEIRFVHVVVCYLRKSLAGTQFDIRTERGVGYRLTWRDEAGRRSL